MRILRDLFGRKRNEERSKDAERKALLAPYRAGRKYDTTPLPTLGSDAPASQIDRDRLFKLYDQICATWRELVGVRFRLLALIPPVSLALLVAVLSTGSTTVSLTLVRRTLVIVVGLIATIGLLIYDLRNSALHDDLISRGRKIEEELGFDTGLFLGRRTPKTWLVQHDHATALIYGAAILGWVAALAAIWLEAGTSAPPS
jgi:hypothetical protein